MWFGWYLHFWGSAVFFRFTLLLKPSKMSTSLIHNTQFDFKVMQKNFNEMVWPHIVKESTGFVYLILGYYDPAGVVKMLIKQTLYFLPRQSAHARCPCSTLTQNRHRKLTYFKLWVVNGSDRFPCCALNSDWNGAVLGCWSAQWREFSHRLRHLTSHLDTVLRPCYSLRIHSRKEEDQCLSS